MFTHPKSALRKSPFYGHFRRWVSVQVPLPAVLRNAINVAGMPCLSHFLQCICIKRFYFRVEKNLPIAYNMLNKEADTIVYTYPFPAKRILLRNSTFTLLERGCYFLFFKFRIATISRPKVSKTINSSYVLIRTASFPQGSEWRYSHPIGSPVKGIILLILLFETITASSIFFSFQII